MKKIMLIIFFLFISIFSLQLNTIAFAQEGPLDKAIKEVEKLHENLVSVGKLQATLRDEYASTDPSNSVEWRRFIKLDTEAKNTIDRLRVNKAWWQKLQSLKELSPEERAEEIARQQKLYPKNETVRKLADIIRREENFAKQIIAQQATQAAADYNKFLAKEAQDNIRAIKKALKNPKDYADTESLNKQLKYWRDEWREINRRGRKNVTPPSTPRGGFITLSTCIGVGCAVLGTVDFVGEGLKNTARDKRFKAVGKEEAELLARQKDLNRELNEAKRLCAAYGIPPSSCEQVRIDALDKEYYEVAERLREIRKKYPIIY